MNSSINKIIEDIRLYVSQSSEIPKEELVNNVVSDTSYYLINIKYPKSITPTLLEDITRILIDNQDLSAFDVLNYAKNVMYVEKVLESVQPVTTVNYLSIYSMLNICMMPVILEIDNISVLMNKPGGDNYMKIYSNNQPTIFVDFVTIDAYYSDPQQSSRFKNFNDLVGRIGVSDQSYDDTSKKSEKTQSGKIIIPSAQVSANIDNKQTVSSRIPMSILEDQIKKITIPTIGVFSSVNDLIKLNAEVKQKLHYVISTTLSDTVSYTYLDIDYSSTAKKVIEPKKQLVYLPKAGGDRLIIVPCSHIDDKKQMDSDEFYAKYITKSNYKGYCKVCGERIMDYDDIVDVLDKSFGDVYTSYTNFKLFNVVPYKNYITAIHYVVEKNNRLTEVFKIIASDVFLAITKTLIDILIYMNDNRDSLIKKYSKEISEGYVFIPRLTNQLFMTEMYEKEKFGDIKKINTYVLYFICLCIRKGNFLLLLSQYFKEININKIFSMFMKKMKQDMDVIMKTLNFYLKEDVFPQSIRNAIDTMLSYKLPDVVNEKQDVLHDVVFDVEYDSVSKTDVDSRTLEVLSDEVSIGDYQRSHYTPASTYALPQVKISLPSNTIIVKTSKPQLSFENALSSVKGMSLIYEYWYGDERITQITFYDKTVGVESIEDEEKAMCVIGNKKKIVNIYTDTMFVTRGNSVVYYLTDQIPSMNEVNERRLSRYISMLKSKMTPSSLKINIPSYVSTEEIKTLHEMMAYGLMYMSALGKTELLSKDVSV